MFRTNGEEPSAAQRHWQKALLQADGNVLGFMQAGAVKK